MSREYNYTEEFKVQTVKLGESGKPISAIVKEYGIAKSAISKWHYICLLLDLSNRKIIGSAVGKHKDTKLVRAAFYGIQADLRRVEIFHTDRGSKFKNQIIDEIISAFGIRRIRKNIVLFSTSFVRDFRFLNSRRFSDTSLCIMNRLAR